MSKERKFIIILSLIILSLISIGAASGANTYYIDKNSLGGQCDDLGLGTINQPWCSWSVKFWDQKFKLRPGDQVYIRDGTYYERFQFNPGSVFSGTRNKPIVIQAYPGEKVIFDGVQSGGNGIYIPGSNSYIHIIGPIEVRNYDKCMETNAAVVNRGWVLDGLEAHNCSRGLLMRNFDSLIIKNSKIHDTFGDGEALGIGISGGSKNILIENVRSYKNNDGRGVDGDGDGFWFDQTTDKIELKNVESYGNSEDGFDIKSKNAKIINSKSYDNEIVGIKLWYGNSIMQNVLVYNNGESGIKCTDTKKVEISNLVSIGNLEYGIVGCNGRMQNSIIMNNTQSEIGFEGELINNTFEQNPEFGDITAPVVKIMRPSSNAIIQSAGNTKIIATASDNSEVEKIEIYFDENLKNTCFQTKCEYIFQNKNTPFGKSIVKVRAYDFAGNFGEKIISIKRV